MQRLSLKRQHPNLAPEEIEKRLDRWLAHEDEPR